MVSWRTRDWRTHRFLWRTVAALVATASLTGCTSPDPDEDLVFDEGDPPEELALIENEPELSDSDVELAVFEATWICELQRRSFPSLELRDEAFADALAQAGLDAADYDGFKLRLAEEQELRDGVLFHYQADCLR